MTAPVTSADSATSPELQPPLRTLDIELSGVVDAIDDRHPEGGRYHGAVVLVRLHGAPLGSITIALPDGGLTGESVRRLAETELVVEIATHHAADGDPAEGTPGCLRSLAEFLASPPPLSVVVASRDRPERVTACVASLLEMDYPDLTVIVVDNAPTSDASARLIAERYGERPNVRYVREDRPGLSRARNRGLRDVGTEFVAFADDDILVDRHWAAELVRQMVEDPQVGCVTSMILAAELETSAQLWIEQYGGFAKGFRRQVHVYPPIGPVSPLFPYDGGSLGSGAAMAFRTVVLRHLGGFDQALGGGTPARGGEDLAIFVAVLLAGWGLVYEPGAIVWHFHHRGYERLRQVMIGYGSGLSAFLMRTALHHPRRLPGITRRTARGLRHLLDPRSSKNSRKGSGYPAELTHLEMRGFVFGPLWYLRGLLPARPRLRLWTRRRTGDDR